MSTASPPPTDLAGLTPETLDLRQRVSEQRWLVLREQALQRAALLRAIKVRYAQVGSWQRALAEVAPTVHRSTFLHWRRCHQQRTGQDWERLLDRRVPPSQARIPQAVKDAACLLRRANPLIDVSAAQTLLRAQFGDNGAISPAVLHRVWNAAGLAQPRGRTRPAQRRAHPGGGGLALLAAAVAETGVMESLAQAVLGAAQQTADAQTRLPDPPPDATRDGHGRFTAAYNQALSPAGTPDPRGHALAEDRVAALPRAHRGHAGRGRARAPDHRGCGSGDDSLVGCAGGAVPAVVHHGAQGRGGAGGHPQCAGGVAALSPTGSGAAADGDLPGEDRARGRLDAAGGGDAAGGQPAPPPDVVRDRRAAGAVGRCGGGGCVSVALAAPGGGVPERAEWGGVGAQPWVWRDDGGPCGPGDRPGEGRGAGEEGAPEGGQRSDARSAVPSDLAGGAAGQADGGVSGASACSANAQAGPARAGQGRGPAAAPREACRGRSTSGIRPATA